MKGDCLLPDKTWNITIEGNGVDKSSISCCLYSVTSPQPLELKVQNLTLNSPNVVYLDRNISKVSFVSTNIILEDVLEINVLPFFSISGTGANAEVTFEESTISIDVDGWHHSYLMGIDLFEGSVNFYDSNMVAHGDISKQPPIVFESRSINLERTNFNSTVVIVFRATDKVALVRTDVTSNRFILDAEQVYMFDNHFNNNLNRSDYQIDQLILLEVDLTCNRVVDKCDGAYIIASGNVFKEYGMRLYVDNTTNTLLSYISYSIFEMGKTSYAIRVTPVPSRYIPNPIISHFNWYGHPSGPTICCNPKGEGASLSIHVDYSLWCLNSQCTQSVISSPTEGCMRDGCYLALSEPSTIGLIVLGCILLVSFIVGAIIFRFVVLKKTIDSTKRQFLFTLISCIGVVAFVSFSYICIVLLGVTECKPRDQNICLNRVAVIAVWTCLLPLTFHAGISSFGIYLSTTSSSLKRRRLRLFNILCLVAILMDVCIVLFVTSSFFLEITPPILALPIVVILLSGCAQTVTFVFAYRLREHVEDPDAIIVKQLIVKKRWSLQSELKENKDLEKKAKKVRILLIVLDVCHRVYHVYLIT